MFENTEYGQRVRLRFNRTRTEARELLLAQVCVSVWLQMDLQKIRPSSTFDMDKLKSTMKQFVRDWSEDGRAERDSCYRPIIQEIQRLFPSHQQ